MVNNETTENQKKEPGTELVVKDNEPEVIIKIIALGRFGQTITSSIFSDDQSCSQIELLQIDRNDYLDNVTNFLAATDLLIMIYDLDAWKEDLSLIDSLSKLASELGILTISLLPYSNTIDQRLESKLQKLLFYTDTMIPLKNTPYSSLGKKHLD